MCQRACYKAMRLRGVAVRWLGVLCVGTGLVVLLSTWFSTSSDQSVINCPGRFKFATQNSTSAAQLHYANQHIPNQTKMAAIATPSNQLTLSKPIKTENNGSMNRSYVLALAYLEQLSAATHVMFTLGALAADWGSWMVEPFVIKSFIFGFQNMLPPNIANVESKQKIRLFDIYDATEVNKCFNEGVPSNVTMVDMEMFLSDASRDVTVFHFSSERIFSLDAHDSKLLQRETAGKPQPVECNLSKLPSFKKMLERLETVLNNEVDKLIAERPSRHLSKAKFIIKRTFCLDQNTIYTSDMLQKYLPPETTVIFTSWRGCGLTKCFITNEENEQASEWRDKNRYGIRTRTVVTSKLSDQFKLHHPSIERAARKYLDHLGYRHPFISIHIRAERLHRSSKAGVDPLQYIDDCLKTICDILDTLQNNMTRQQHSRMYNNQSSTLLLTDIGQEYGTSTCRGRRCNQSNLKKVALRLHKLGLNVQSFDPNMVGAIQNSGYVSLVEMHMLASGSKLVLVGHGGFQSILKQLYLSQGHHSEDVFHVCVDK